MPAASVSLRRPPIPTRSRRVGNYGSDITFTRTDSVTSTIQSNGESDGNTYSSTKTLTSSSTRTETEVYSTDVYTVNQTGSDTYAISESITNVAGSSTHDYRQRFQHAVGDRLTFFRVHRNFDRERYDANLRHGRDGHGHQYDDGNGQQHDDDDVEQP